MDRDDRFRSRLGDHRMASTCIVGPIRGHRLDVFSDRDLRQSLRRDRAVTVAAGGEFDRANAASGRAIRQMNLPSFAPARRIMPARQPFSVAAETDAGTVYKKV